MKPNDQVREEMNQIQDELRDALDTLLREVGSRLKPRERDEIEQEVDELNELLNRIKSGMVWISLFGKTSVGKSALANAIIEADEAGVDVGYDHTTNCTAYQRPPWMIVDVPGIMGKSHLENVATAEARRAHGHIFIVDGEPYADEIELFDIVHAACPHTPKLVFMNKADRLEHMPRKDRERTLELVRSKMRKYVASDDDILFGSAQLYNGQTDAMERQAVPHLIDRLYDGAGTLGAIVNVLDPAGRATNLGSQIREKVAAVRMRIGRRVAGVLGALEVGAAFVPFSQLVATPALLASLAFVQLKIMGKNPTKAEAGRLCTELLKACGTVLAGDFAVVAGFAMAFDALSFLGPVGLLAAAVGNLAGLGYWRFRRTVIFGEVVMEYARRDFSWGGESAEEVIKACKERALAHHTKFSATMA